MVTSKFKRYLYPQCSNVFIQVRNICFTGSLRMGGGTIFKVGGHKCTSKKLENLCDLKWQLTSQALKYDAINLCQHV